MANFPHPLLRVRNEDKSTVSFSELLFDLIYVFAVTQLSHYLLHNLIWFGFVQETVLWFGVWLIWQHTAWVTNWFNPDKRSIKFMLFLLIVLGLVMTAAIPEAFASRGLLFAVCYVTIQIGRTSFVLFSLGNKHPLAASFKRILGWFCISGIFWISGAFFEGNTRLLLWAIAVLCDYTSPMFGFYLPGLDRSDSGKEWTIEGHHMAERIQLFVIIAFGGIILMSGATFSEIEVWNSPIVIAAITSFIGSLAMWWIYFDTSSEVGSRRMHKTSNPALLGLKFHAVHVVLIGALIVCAVGNNLAIIHPREHMEGDAIAVLIAGPIVYLLANMAYKWITCRIIAMSHIIAIGLLIILIPVSLFYFTRLESSFLVTLIMLLIIIFDLLTKSNKSKVIA